MCRHTWIPVIESEIQIAYHYCPSCGLSSFHEPWTNKQEQLLRHVQEEYETTEYEYDFPAISDWYDNTEWCRLHETNSGNSTKSTDSTDSNLPGEQRQKTSNPNKGSTAGTTTTKRQNSDAMSEETLSMHLWYQACADLDLKMSTLQTTPEQRTQSE